MKYSNRSKVYKIRTLNYTVPINKENTGAISSEWTSATLGAYALGTRVSRHDSQMIKYLIFNSKHSKIDFLSNVCWSQGFKINRERPYINF